MFIMNMITKPLWLKFLFSEDCERCINYKSATHGHVIHGIKDMAQAFVNAYPSVNCSTLILALSRWRLIDLQSNITLPQLINVIFDAIKLELGDSQHCTSKYNINPLETNLVKIQSYFDNIKNGLVDEIVGVKMIHHQKCVKCMYQWFKFSIENYVHLPMHGLHARYWIQSNGDILAHSFDITPNSVLNWSFEQLVMKAVADHELLDDDIEIEMQHTHFVLLNKQAKYLVYFTYMVNMQNDMVWHAKKVSEVGLSVYEYIKQFEYTVVLCEIPTSAPKYDNFHFEITEGDFVNVTWDNDNNNNNNNNNEEKNSQNNANVPEGDTSISLTHQWEQYINNGHIIEDICPQCETKQKIISKSKIFAWPSNPIIYIDQQQSNYYKLLWPFKNNQIHLSKNSNNKIQPITFKINHFISQKTPNDYVAHWRRSELCKVNKKNKMMWYTIGQNQIHKHENIEETVHACLFILTLKK